MITSSKQPTWRISLAFWLTLTAAASLYAAVSLAPGFRTLQHLGLQHFDNRVELAALEDRIAYLERVRQALEINPGFATELARLDQQTARPGESRLAVDRSLQLVPRLTKPSDPAVAPWAQWSRPLVNTLAQNSALRLGLLVTAACLVLFAFALLQDSQADRLVRWRGEVARGWNRLVQRYR
ncbi:MAG: hypothetical protein QF363_05360 [Planctomycetaceae bacterium]|mgnify:CR=1 FL=1|nr:hypothetical protein [Planctomycetaceae bacterium]